MNFTSSINISDSTTVSNISNYPPNITCSSNFYHTVNILHDTARHNAYNTSNMFASRNACSHYITKCDHSTGSQRTYQSTYIITTRDGIYFQTKILNRPRNGSKKPHTRHACIDGKTGNFKSVSIQCSRKRYLVNCTWINHYGNPIDSCQVNVVHQHIATG